MDNYFWDDDIKVTPTSFFYEYQEMRKAHRMVDEKLEFLASVLVRKYGIPEAVRKYERYTQNRTDEYLSMTKWVLLNLRLMLKLLQLLSRESILIGKTLLLKNNIGLKFGYVTN